MDPLDLEIEANKEKARKLAKELCNITRQTHEKENQRKAKSSLQGHQTYQYSQLTHKEHKPNAVIKPEVCKLIWDNVNGNGMKVSKAIKTFKVPRHQIQRIKNEYPNSVKTVQQRPSKFSEEMKTELLHEINQKSSTTLAELA